MNRQTEVTHSEADVLDNSLALEVLCDEPGMTIEELAEQVGWEPGRVAGCLLTLQVSGLSITRGGLWFPSSRGLELARRIAAGMDRAAAAVRENGLS